MSNLPRVDSNNNIANACANMKKNTRNEYQEKIRAHVVIREKKKTNYFTKSEISVMIRE